MCYLCGMRVFRLFKYLQDWGRVARERREERKEEEVREKVRVAEEQFRKYDAMRKTQKLLEEAFPEIAPPSQHLSPSSQPPHLSQHLLPSSQPSHLSPSSQPYQQPWPEPYPKPELYSGQYEPWASDRLKDDESEEADCGRSMFDMTADYYGRHGEFDVNDEARRISEDIQQFHNSDPSADLSDHYYWDDLLDADTDGYLDD